LIAAGARVRVLEWLRETVGLPATIAVDHGPEFVRRTFHPWAYAQHMELRFI